MGKKDIKTQILGTDAWVEYEIRSAIAEMRRELIRWERAVFVGARIEIEEPDPLVRLQRARASWDAGLMLLELRKRWDEERTRMTVEVTPRVSFGPDGLPRFETAKKKRAVPKKKTRKKPR